MRFGSDAKSGRRFKSVEVLQMAKLTHVKSLPIVPRATTKQLSSDATWYYAPAVIALQSAWLVSTWLSSLLIISWTPILRAAEAGKSADSSRVAPLQVIATGSNVTRVVRAADARSAAHATSAHSSSSGNIIAFPKTPARRDS